ncbi:MAG TPA: HEAT repeat domain-containing protein [Stellaceae bacterium]|nr:HEAT repeat domain-containing protein [Stellaceae bacterium]
MTKTPSLGWSDDKIVQSIHRWSVERSKCGFDALRYNKMDTDYLTPGIKILKNRGKESLAKLLPMLEDANREVRLTAASIAYQIDTAACRKVLRDLMETPDGVGLMAWAALYQLDPSVAPTPIELWGEQP